MKIALICPYILSQPGGIRSHVFALQKEFGKNGHKAIVFGPRSRVPENYGSKVKLIGTGIPVNSLGTNATLSAAITPMAGWDLEKYKFDIIHFHQPFAPFLPAQLLLSSPGPNVATFHSYLEEEKIPSYGESYFSLTKNIIFPKLDKLIAVSDKAAGVFKRYTKRHFDIIPNGVDLSRFHPSVKPSHKFLDGKINVLYVGRLEKRKGVDYLIEAWGKLRKVKNIRLIIVGEGPMKEELHETVRERGLRNIVFEGAISEKVLPS
ncbi:MAG: Glycosyl transferase group 1 [Candidatus Gottesmanbacteria bacterium GW2011_GWC2_39_8]|uniref:Glycosyl transferase group 1 n=1 Tax=Candidatus Gottesmanbacteria bacterium GW2011_GWC2_39_8 TaxID=1618450 RepID=A0A0G0PVJ1_9BACT|nr:MAG: Glycosyl transferase group 1 [Candidatus Gottesmanbacteria bacterium GW2011_GWC2_39_8]